MEEPREFYDHLGADYDLIIDWPARLRREGPLLRTLAQSVEARDALDVGGGTGRHAQYLRDELCLAVTLADPSEESLAEARRRLGDDATLLRLGLGELGDLPQYDLAVCLGNTLPHVADHAAFERALEELYARVRPGGVLVCHQLGYPWILADFARRRFFPAGGTDERFFLRFFERDGEALRFTILRVTAEAGEHRAEFHSTRHLPLTAEHYGAVLDRLGPSRVWFHGDWDGSPYQAETSDVLIVVVRK